MINEVLANEPGGDVGGEFVELVNVGGADADLSGWTLEDSRGVRHRFDGVVLAPGTAWVVFGEDGFIPSGLDGASAATTGTLALSNGGDSVLLRDGAGSLIDRVDYDGTLSDDDGVSMNRTTDGDPDAGFVLHTQLGDASSSPGTTVAGDTRF
jgi:hypothetical protein